MTSIREAAYEIGRTTVFSERDALTAGAWLSEDYPDQTTVVRLLDAVKTLAEVEGRTLAAMAVQVTDCLRGRAIA